MGNLIIEALPRNEYELLQSQLSEVHLKKGKVLFNFNEPVRAVYFPIYGLVSCFAKTREGNTIEVYSVGREGIVEMSAVLTQVALVQAKVQIPGSAFWIPVDELCNLLHQTTVLPRLLLRCACSSLMRILQNTACAKFHSVEQRLSLWLLIAHDRTAASVIRCTHETLAQVLGIRRATVTTTVSALHNIGVLRQGRGSLTIADMKELERIACTCFDIIRASDNVEINC